MKRNTKSDPSRPRPRLLVPAWVAASIALAGCHHRSVLSDPEVLRAAAIDSDDSQGLVLQAGKWEKVPKPEPGTPQGDYQIAEALYRAEDYPKAERAFEEVADKHKKDPEIHEKALFMRAESQFQQGHYTGARDSYGELLKTYPGSPHLSAAVQRLFVIADGWLDDARADVRRGHTSSFPHRFFQFDPEHKPLFDIDGHAIKELSNIRERDPNGPLADDTLMMTAGYHYSMGDYRDADTYYDQLIHNYPRSEYQPQAHVLSAEAKLQAYKGASYEGRQLEEAKRILQAALNQYPNELEAERQRIYQKLDAIRQEQAKSQFEIGEWYRRMGHPLSARVYYQYVVSQKDFAGTKWAERAGERLAELGSDAPVAATLGAPAGTEQAPAR